MAVIGSRFSSLFNDSNGDAKVSPGDVLLTQIVISNATATPLTTVVVNDTLTANTTYVAGTIVVTTGDTYALTGNTPATFGTGGIGPGLLANDYHGDGANVNTSTGLSVALVNGVGIGGAITVKDAANNALTAGSVNVGADGTFTFTPAAGYTGTAAFTYSISDGSGIVGSATVHLGVAGLVWYVDGSAAGGGDGTFGNPFNNLAPVSAVDHATDTVVLHGTVTTAAAFVMKTGEILYGDGSTYTVNGHAITTGSATDSTINHSAGGITLASGNTIDGVDLSGTTAAATGVTDGGATVGALTINHMAIGGQGQIIDIDQGGTLNVALKSAASTGFSGVSQGGAIDLQGVSGTVGVAGTTSITGTQTSGGIDVAAAGLTATFTGATTLTTGATAALTLAGGTANFNGGAAITTTTGAALTTTGGTLNIASGSISTTTGHIVDMTNTTVGTVALSSLASSAAVVGSAIKMDNVDGGTFGATTVNVAGAAGDGIHIGTGSSTAFTFGNTTIAAITNGNQGIDISGNTTAAGAANVTFNGTVGVTTTTGASGVVIDGNNGAVTFSGSSVVVNSGIGNGVTISNDSATVGFSGGNLNVDSTTGTAFSAAQGTGTGGALNITGANNSIAAVGGRALNIDGVTSNVTLHDIAANGGTSTGVFLKNTGSGGQFVVTGTGSTAGSGGVFNAIGGADAGSASAASQTGTGIYMENVSNVSLSNLNFTGAFTNFGIRGEAVTNFTLKDSNLTGTFGDNTALIEGAVRFGTQSSGGVGLTGTALFTGNTIQGGWVHNVSVTSYGSGTLTMTVNDSANHSAIFNNTSAGSQGASDLEVETGGTTTLNFTSTGVDYNGSHDFNLHVVSDAQTVQNINISNNVFNNLQTQTSGAGNIAITGQLLSTNTATNGIVHYTIDSNVLKGANGSNIFGGFNGTGGTVTGVITNNTVGTLGGGYQTALGTTGSLNGGLFFGGIDGKQSSASTYKMDLRIEGNHVYDTNSAGGVILLRSSADDNTGTERVEATIKNNVASEFGANVPSFIYAQPAGSSLTAFGTLGMEISGNNVTFASTATQQSGLTYDGSNGTSTFYMPGFAGTSDNAGIAAFLASKANVFTNANPAVNYLGPTVGNKALVDPVPLTATMPSGQGWQDFVQDKAPSDPTVTTDPSDTTGGTGGTTGGTGGTTGGTGGTGSTTTTPPTEVTSALTQDALDQMVSAAIHRWELAGATPEQIAAMKAVTVTVSNIAGLEVGDSTPGHVQISTNGAGYGWFVDATPGDDAEFTGTGSDLTAAAGSAAAGHIDLLTVLEHELGHQIGLSDLYSPLATADLMYGYINPSERRLPTSADVSAANGTAIDHEAFALAPVTIPTLGANTDVDISYRATVNSFAAGLAPTLSGQSSITWQGLASPITMTETITSTNDSLVNSAGTPSTQSLAIATLTLGDLVFKDLNQNGAFDAGDTGLDGVTVKLYVDSNANGVFDSASDTLVTQMVTAGGGHYSFGNLAPGDYIVVIAGTQFASGQPLFGLGGVSSAQDPDNNTDSDNNGAAVGSDVATQAITLTYGGEFGTNGDTNNTLDIGLVPVNQAPAIANLQGDTATYTEDTNTSVRIDVGTNAVVSDFDSPNFNGGSLTASISSGFVASKDRIGIFSDATVAVTGNNVSVNGLLVGTVTGNSVTGTPTLVLTFTTDNATPAAVQAVVQRLFYGNGFQDPVGGTRAVTVTLVDGDGTANGGHDTSTYTTSVNVISINDAPGGADATLTLSEDGFHVMTAADFGFVTDGATNSNAENQSLLAVKITTLPGVGTLYLDTDGAGTGSLGTAVTAGQFVSATDINAGHLVYVPAANGNGNGYANFTFQVQDDGGTANGGVDTDPTPNTITFNVTAVNDAPVLDLDSTTAGTGVTVTTAEQNLIMPAPNATLSDIDSADFAGGSLTVGYGAAMTASDGVFVSDDSGQFSTGGHIGVSSNTIYYNTVVIGTIASGGLGSPLVINFNSNATPAAVQELIHRVNTFNISDTPPAGARTLTYTVTDGDGGVTHADAAVTFTPVNDAPSGADESLNVFDNANHVFTVAEFTNGYTDPEGNNLSAVKIDSLPAKGSLTDNGVPVTVGQFIPVADISAGNLVYTPDSTTGGNAYNFKFQVQDDGGTANGGVNLDPAQHVFTLNVDVSNQAPVAVGETLADAYEDQPTVYSEATLLAGDSDPDAGDTIHVTGASNAVHGTVSYDAATHAVTFTSDANYSGPAQFDYTITDSHGATSTATDTLTVQPTNDAPTITGLDGDTNTQTEDHFDDMYIDVGANAVVTDIDSTDFDGGSLVVSIANYNGEDSIGIYQDGILEIDGSNNVLVNGVAIGVASGGYLDIPHSGTFTIAFNDQATPARVQELVRHIFAGDQRSEPDGGTRTVNITLTDGDGTAHGGTDHSDYSTTFTIVSVNDEPVGADKTITINEDNAYALQTGDFGFQADASGFESGNLQAVKITTLPTGGTLYLDTDGAGTGSLGTPITTGQFVSAADIAAGHLVYVPAQDASGTGAASFTFQVQDDGGTANGGVDTDQSANTITFDITAVNDAPAYSGATAGSGSEDGSITFSTGSANAIVITDVDGGAPYTATLTVGHGVLAATASGAANVTGAGSGTLTVTGTLADVNATLDGLKYTPAANFNGADTLHISTMDADGTANGGHDTGATDIALTVNAVNDAPTVVNGTTATAATIAEDTPSATGQTVTTLFGGHFSDATDQVTGGSAANSFAGVAVTANGSSAGTGQWQYFDGASWVNVGAVSNGAALLLAPSTALRFNPAQDYNGQAPTLTTHLIDNSAGSVTTGTTADLSAAGATGGTTAYSTGTVALGDTITAVNDNPVLTATGTSFNYTENGPAHALFATLAVSDVDNANFNGGTLTITDAASDPGDSLAIGSDPDITFTPTDATHGTLAYQNNTFGTLTVNPNGYSVALNANATPAAIHALLADLGYVNTSDDPVGGDHAVTVTLTDGAGGTANFVTHINVIPVNDNPSIANLDGDAITYVENDVIAYLDTGATAPNVIAVPGPGNALVTDPDSHDFAGATLTVAVSGNKVATEDRILFTFFNAQTPGQISVSGANVFYGSTQIGTLNAGGVGVDRVVTFNANATSAMVDAVIHQFGYANTSDNPSTLDRTIAFTLTDGDGGSTVAHTVVHVTPVNDNPTLDLDSSQPGTGANNGLFEQDPSGSGGIAYQAVVTDADSSNFDTGTLTVSLTANGQSGDHIDVSSFFSDPGNTHTVTTSGNQILFDGTVVATYTAGDMTTPLVITFNANSTPLSAGWVARAVDVTFVNDDPSSAVRTLHYVLTDGDGGTASADATYNVTAANDAPQLSAPTNASVSFTENNPAVAILQGVVLTDPDNPTNFSTGSIDIAVTGTPGGLNLKAGSNFVIHDNGNSTYTLMGPGNVAIGDITGFGTTHLQITNLTANATPATLNDLIDDWTFSIAGDDVADASGTITLTFNDGHHTGYFGDGALTAQQTQSLSVTGLNDAPVNSVPAGTQQANEDSSLTFNAANSNLISVSDADDDGGSLTVTLSVAHGTISLSTTASLSFSAGDGSSDATMTFSGTKAAINTALNGLVYTPTGDFNGDDSLSITTNDNGNSGDGPAGQDVDTVAIHVKAVNDAPTIVNGSSATAPAIDEDTPSATGDTIGGLFGGHYSDQTDNQSAYGGSFPGAMGGIAVTGNLSTPSIGQWQYWNGASWTNIGSVSNASALTLSAGTTIRFNPAQDYNGAAPQLTVHLADNTVSITDGAHIDLSVAGATGGTTAWSAGIVTLDETVNPVNDAPVLDLNGAAAGTGTDLSFNEGDPALHLAPAGTVVDVDSPDFDGATLTVQFTSGGTQYDQLIVAGLDPDAGGQIFNGSAEVIATVSGGSDPSDPLIITFTSFATASDVQNVLHMVAYADYSNAMTSGDRTISFVLTDGDGGTSNLATSTVHVTAVDSPAVLNDDQANTDELSTVIVPVTSNDSDPDGPPPAVTKINGNAISSGQTITLPSGAKLTLNADGTLTYDPNHQYDTLTSTAGGETGASNTQAADSFSYTTQDGSTASVTVTIDGVANAADHLEGSNGNDVVTGTPHADYFDFTQGGSDSGFGLGGDDAFYFGAAYDQNDKVDGGAGTDTVGIRGNYTGGGAVTILGGNMVGVEVLSLMTSTGGPVGYDITWKDGNLATNQKMSIYAGNLQVGENATFNGSAETHGYFLMYGGLGNDHFVGGAGSDGFYFGPGKFSQADFVDGGGGAQNQLGLDGSYNFSAASALGTLGGNFVNIQTIVLYGGDPRDVANPYPNVYHIETNDMAVAAGKTLNIYGAQTIGDFYFNGSAETDGAFNILAGSGNDTLIGGAGNDTIYGGLGSDTLTGGAGNDVFVFTDVAQSIGANVDRITDFTLGDKINLTQIDADTTQAGDQAFTFIGSGTFTNHAGELRAEYDAAHDIWTVQGDVNGDGVTDITIVVHTTNAHPLAGTDFFL